MKSRAKLLGMLVLLPLASVPLTTADSEEAEEEAASAAIEAAGEDSAPPLERRRSSTMGELLFDHEMHAEEMELKSVVFEGDQGQVGGSDIHDTERDFKRPIRYIM